MTTTRSAALALAAVLLSTPLLAVDPAPDTPEPGSIEAIARYTTDPKYLPDTVAYIPESATVASPMDALGRLSGTPNELTRVAEIHGYFSRLASESPRVRVETIGRTEEGRDLILALISSEENLARLDRLSGITAALSDPRTTSRTEAEALIREGKPFYYLTGGLHSTETGSPEMLMELAYRLAVSEKDYIRNIRDNVVVMITPVAEPDGRDRLVDWYYRHLRGKNLPFDDLRRVGSPPYWGHYVFHDNNRDGMQLTLALTRAINAAWWRHHPQVFHDLHESLPLLYISTGHGPYSEAIDPLTVNEWTQFAYNETSELQSMGMPGVWVWGFWDGWWPGYLFSVANNHNAIGRFYETFGNSLAGTFERELENVKFVGKSVTERQWYRPWPPDEKVQWSLRNNTNYMQAGVLAALDQAATRSDALLRNYWVKADRAISRGKSEAPHAWIIPREQRDPGRAAYLINQLRVQRIEVHTLDAETESGEETFAAGDWVVRLDQPHRNAAVNFLQKQEFPANEPNPPYDDIAWTWPLLYGVDATRIDDDSILSAAMSPVDQDVVARGEVSGSGRIYLVRDSGQNAIMNLALELKDERIEVAKEGFELDGTDYPAGSLMIWTSASKASAAAEKLGLDFVGVNSKPEVALHRISIPRIAVLHNWTTQDTGWVRYLFDRERIPYTLINPDHVRAGNLARRFDLILVPDLGGDLSRMIHGIDTKLAPLAYTRTSEYPSHGIPDASPDISRGIEFSGLANLQSFVDGGGVVLALSNGGTLVVDSGIARRAGRASGIGSTPGSEIQAKVLAPSPLVYGYAEFPSVFRGNGPVFDVADRDRGLVVMQFGTKEIKPATDYFEISAQLGATEESDFGMQPAGEDPEADEAEETANGEQEKEEKRPLVLSGGLDGDALDGKPAIIDMPVGKGRVVLFNFNPLHRYLNHSDFRFVYNALLNWNAGK